jgi:hypothetical protein
MTLRPIASVVIAVLLAVAGWQVSGASQGQVLHADRPAIALDSDGDFLPDSLEWACLTNALSPDSDGDGTLDFVEVVQRGNPRYRSLPMPSDHEMRLVVTTRNSAGGSEAVMHLLFRFMGDVELLTNLEAYAEVGSVPGLRIPLSTLSLQPIAMEQRAVANEGLWVHLSVSLVSVTVLQAVLPCAISAVARIGTRSLHTSVPLLDHNGTTCSVVPFAAGLFAIQSVASVSTGTVPNNRVCVLQLQSVGGGSGGSAFVVSGAECQDCNDLICGVECAASVGTVLVLPGGVGSITGG